ncbi:uncharacterized protein LOC142330508 isoform X3 [Lycorma delicatula]|uniref:uncharacterized protein LOC142330508 isoform X3 n=1 Tax=Lycorma delicatula TaxID=130591 RepID=UPI003F51611F
MTLPVSSYEELLTRVRTLTQETRQLQRQLDSPLLDLNDNEHSMNTWENSGSGWNFAPRGGPPLSVGSPDPLVPPSVDVQSVDPKTSISCSEGSIQKWPAEYNVWHSVGPTLHHQNSTISNSGSSSGTIKQEETGRSYSQQQLGAKVEMVYSLLSMLGTHDREQMTTTLLAMSSSPDSCQAMRQSGCVPLLVQLVHAREESAIVRQRASQALHNLVHCHTDDKRGRREARVLRLLQQLIDFSDNVPHNSSEQDDPHPGAAIAALMKLSFDEEHRHAMCQLGALHAIATLIQVDAEMHGSQTNNQSCVTVRRYAGMALTNLTFGDSNNKALLCSLQPFMTALVAQLSSPSEDLRQVTASVLRNLSWRADASSKAMLREVGTVSALMHAAMEAKKESTLKSILSALWNLSAHCNLNKVEICSVEGALQYLVEMLSFQAPSRTLAIVESAGGILRNISSHIAVREDYRSILREQNCLPLLLHQLKSPSLTVVSNACGTLWNLSARCAQDQRALWDLGAVPMLRSLVHSKHRMISMGASAALKNLLTSHPDADILDRASRGMPQLLVRKRRALEQELDTSLSETCENIESPERWDSHESITSTHSENIFDRTARVHCHRSGSLQMMKKTGNCGNGNSTANISSPIVTNVGPTSSSTPVDAVKDNKEQKQQQQNNKSSLSNENCVDEQSLVDGMERLVLNNKTVTVDNEQSVNRCNKSSDVATQSETVGEKPVDYSLKYKDDNTVDDNINKSQHHCVSAVNAATDNAEHHGHHLHQHHNLTVEELDTPTDYSLKYHEEESKTHDYNLIVRYGQQPDIASSEVEIDQPTDYSLKYRESDTSGGCDDEQPEVVVKGHTVPSGDDTTNSSNVNAVKNATHVVTSGHYAETDLDETLDYYSEDKVQTYCTEGTPYAFSTATSMSDLRTTESDAHNADNQKSPEESLHSLVPGSDDRIEDHSIVTAVPTSPPADNLMTPNKEEVRGCKAVTFETPLMFSRCSSPESLSSYEPPDDRSSVVSEFSRLTSGMISPSELPDSPTQTVPPSPRNIKPPVVIDSTAADAKTDTTSHPLQNATSSSPLPTTSGEDITVASEGRTGIKHTLPVGATVTTPITPVSLSNSASNNENTTACVSSGVFEDTVSSFKEENTPVHFSTCTSLSSLTFDDEPYQQQDSGILVVKKNEKSDKEKQQSQQDVDAMLAPVSEEEDEDVMLAACINIGMQQQNTNSRQHVKTPKSSSTGGGVINSRLPKPRLSGIPIKFNHTSTVGCTGVSSSLTTRSSSGRHNTTEVCDSNGVTTTTSFNEDTTTEFCTEGTPANISHATSHSDLSMLCALSDDGSSDQDNILAECIQSAMPQARHLKQQRQQGQESRVTPIKKEVKQPSLNQSLEKHEPSPVTSQPHNSSPAAPVPSSSRIRELKGVCADDETECFATEGSPCVFSTRSSLSDLTINSTAKCRDRCQVVSPAPPDDGSSPLSSLEPEVTVLSRQPSIGSLSGDWTEEQALLEQCITSGMPKTKNGENPSVGVVQDTPADENNEEVAAVTTTMETALEERKELHSLITTNQQVPSQQAIDLMQASADTWNDDMSPNDISFPSISLTAPLIASYRSNADDDRSVKCLDDISLTDSNIIRLEEGKVAIIAHMEMESSFMSDLDSVRPPSAMSSLLSLTASISEAEKRKDKMRGFVARRALGGDSSLSWNNIDSIKPPSGMDEILDLENSILSVASITSEVADSSLHSHSEADSHSEDVTLADNLDGNFDPSASAPTSVTSTTIQMSSSPPQRSRTTPKQKRLTGKDRYNTYTINTEDALQNGVSHENSLTEVPTVETENEELTMCDDEQSLSNSDDKLQLQQQKKKVHRITPKQRRLADKDRFRTRTLGIAGDNGVTSSSSPEVEPEAQDVDENGLANISLPSITAVVSSTTASTPTVESEGESQSQEEEFEIEKGKPRVVKPTAPVSPANEGKGIRGRKKVHSHIPVVSKPATAVKTITIATPPPPLQRQGTFTKDDTPTAPSGIPVLAKKGSPAKTVKKKQGTPHNITNNTQTGTTPAVRKLAGRGRAGSLPRTETSKKPAAGVRNSVSNQSLKSEALGSNSSLNANPTASAPRWNSNSNLNSAKKDATSKIASLWKKVEDTKRKETGTKDSRVWIAPNVPHSKQAA